MKTLFTAAFTLLLTSGLATAAEKGLMHCFAFTPIAEATDAQWKAWQDATDLWPKKYPGIKTVWYGKLRRPLAQFQVDAAASKKLAAGEKEVEAKAKRVVREYGACMLFTDEEALKNYTAQPYHKDWTAAYEKVRVAGTTTYDILSK